MKFLLKIRQNLGFSLLKSKVKKLKREKAFNNLETASTVGLLFDSSQQINYIAAANFINELRDNGKTVEALGMVLNQDMLRYFPERDGLKFFRLDDLNFWGYPKAPCVAPFINKKFDVLINLCVEENLSVDYVMGMSMSKLKVSMDLKDNDFADFILHFGTAVKLDSELLLKKIKDYLSAFRRG